MLVYLENKKITRKASRLNFNYQAIAFLAI